MQSTEDEEPKPTGRLGAFDIGCVVTGGIIGVGIFFTPSKVAAVVDSSEQMIAAWFLGGLVAILGAMVFADLARRVPGHGGTFVYIHEAFGRLPAFIYGWANWLVIQAGALGVIGLVLVDYLYVLLHGDSASVTPGYKVFLAALAISSFTILNAFGLRVGRGAGFRPDCGDILADGDGDRSGGDLGELRGLAGRARGLCGWSPGLSAVQATGASMTRVWACLRG